MLPYVNTDARDDVDSQIDSDVNVDVNGRTFS